MYESKFWPWAALRPLSALGLPAHVGEVLRETGAREVRDVLAQAQGLWIGDGVGDAGDCTLFLRNRLTPDESAAIRTSVEEILGEETAYGLACCMHNGEEGFFPEVLGQAWGEAGKGFPEEDLGLSPEILARCAPWLRKPWPDGDQLTDMQVRNMCSALFFAVTPPLTQFLPPEFPPVLDSWDSITYNMLYHLRYSQDYLLRMLEDVSACSEDAGEMLIRRMHLRVALLLRMAAEYRGEDFTLLDLARKENLETDLEAELGDPEWYREVFAMLWPEEDWTRWRAPDIPGYPFWVDCVVRSVMDNRSLFKMEWESSRLLLLSAEDQRLKDVAQAHGISMRTILEQREIVVRTLRQSELRTLFLEGPPIGSPLSWAGYRRLSEGAEYPPSGLPLELRKEDRLRLAEISFYAPHAEYLAALVWNSSPEWGPVFGNLLGGMLYAVRATLYLCHLDKVFKEAAAYLSWSGLEYLGMVHILVSALTGKDESDIVERRPAVALETMHAIRRVLDGCVPEEGYVATERNLTLFLGRARFFLRYDAVNRLLEDNGWEPEPEENIPEFCGIVRAALIRVCSRILQHKRSRRADEAARQTFRKMFSAPLKGKGGL